MVRMTFIGLLISLVISPWQSLSAETLVVNGIDVSGSREVRGLSMQSVRAKWGEPRAKRGAIGDPPISRWDYPNYGVYFEYDHVVHAVQKR